jgi:YbbR domain-containing protein
MKQFLKTIQETLQFLGYLVRSTFRSLRDNKGLAAVSVVLAFGVWIVVTEADNPTRSSVVDADIPVLAINTPDTIAVVKPLPTVRVRVAVDNNVFDSLTPADFLATVDLANLTVGDFDKLPVNVRTTTSRGNLRVTDVLPTTIKVQLRQLASKSVTITQDVQGTVVSGFTMSTPELETSSVIVSGPQDEVDKVSRVVATINVEGLTESFDGAVRLFAQDVHGTLVPNVDLDHQLTNVHIKIEQQKFSRSMAVAATLSGAPADGYNVVSVSVSPPTVTVRGEEAYIAGTASVPTKPIDLDNASEDVVKSVSLDLPTGAEVTGGGLVVTVTVRIEPANGVFNFTVPVTIRNLGDDVAVSGALPSVTITLSGSLPLLRDLSPNDIPASIDLDGKDPGVNKVKVDVTAPAGLTIVQVNPAEIDITLVKR